MAYKLIGIYGVLQRIGSGAERGDEHLMKILSISFVIDRNLHGIICIENEYLQPWNVITEYSVLRTSYAHCRRRSLAYQMF